MSSCFSYEQIPIVGINDKKFQLSRGPLTIIRIQRSVIVRLTEPIVIVMQLFIKKYVYKSVHI